MTDHATDPPRDPIVGALHDQADALDRLGDALGEVSRETCEEIAKLRNTLEGAIEGFAEQHGKREAEEVEAVKQRQTMQATLDGIVGQLRSFGKRLTANEKDIDDLKAAELARAGRNGSNGNGEDHAG